MSTADATGSVLIGRFTLEVGDPDGMAIARDADDGGGTAELAHALRDDPDESRPILPTAATGAIEAGAEATARAEEVVGLFRAVVEGKILDPQHLAKRVDLLLEELQRMDEEGRHADALKLARAIAGLLALMMRWVELVRSLGIALRAAQELGSETAVAWVDHQLGTLHLAAGNAARAERRLGDARAHREHLAELRALALTERNQRVLCRELWEVGCEGRFVTSWRRRHALALALAAVALLCLGGAAGALVQRGLTGDDAQDPAALGDFALVTVEREGGGRVISEPSGIACPPICEQEFPPVDEVVLIARDSGSATFRRWAGGCEAAGRRCQVVPDRPRTVIARFAPDPEKATLTVNLAGDGAGVVTSRPDGIDCTMSCEYDFTAGTRVRLRAVAAEGSVFIGWDRTDCSDDPCVVDVDSAITVTARFDRRPVTPEPGTPDPGTPDPGTPDPGTPDPGTPDPGTPDPGTPQPEP